MLKIPLNEYLARHSQKAFAEAIGTNQSAVSQMVKSARNIEVTVHDDGRVEANEIRPVPARPGKRSQSA